MANSKKAAKKKAADQGQQKFLLDLLKGAKVVPISVPKPDPNNPRDHSARNVKVIKASIKKFGQVIPILLDADTDMIVSGHGTMRAIEEIGQNYVLVVYKKFESESEREQLRDIMNRSAELAEWDYQLLGKAIRGYQEGQDMGLMGWEGYELGPILAADWKPPPMGDLNGSSDGGPDMGRPVSVTKEQRAVFDRVIAKVCENEGDPNISEGRCLELISADFLSG